MSYAQAPTPLRPKWAGNEPGEQRHMIDDLPHDRDIEWLLTASEAAIGLASTTGAIIGVAMRGGPSNLNSNDPDGMTDHRLKAVGRQREVVTLWNRVPHEHQCVLKAYYEPRRPPPGVREALNRLAGVAVLLARDAHLASASAHLADPEKHKRPQQITKAARHRVSESRKAALEAVVAAHQAVQVARAVVAEEWANG